VTPQRDFLPGTAGYQPQRRGGTEDREQGGTATRNYGLSVAPPDGADENYGAYIGGKVGIGTEYPKAQLQVENGDVYASTAGQGLIVRSPDGTKCARIGIDNAGALAVVALACP